MSNFTPKVLKQEVNELTSLLRNDKEWKGLREALQEKGFDADRIVLAGFMEDSDENEFGVVITDELKVFEYKRNTSEESGQIVEWRLVKDVNGLLDTFPAVIVGLEIAKNMENG
jgi:hypothetical protein